MINPGVVLVTSILGSPTTKFFSQTKMSTTFEDITSECESAGQVNLLPFGIEFDGKAEIEAKFNSRRRVTRVPGQSQDDLGEKSIYLF